MKNLAISFLFLTSIVVLADAFACDGSGQQAQAPSTGTPITSGSPATAK